MKNCSLLKLFNTLLIGILLLGNVHAQLPLNENGWSIIEPSEDSRIIYVSYSEGDNDNDGLSADFPKKTIEAADDLMRSGYPDHMLLKRGDVWPAFSGFDRWKSGRSAEEPIVISYYGNSGDRPVIKTTNYFLNPNGYEFNYQAFVGIELYNSVHDPDSPDFDDATNYNAGIRLIGGGQDILFEDCRFRFMQITTTTYRWEGHEENIVSNFKLRRCIITDNWAHNTTTAHDARPQGYYTSDTYGILIEECVFDHNGWNESFEDANANMYNHNIYMSTANYGPIVVRGNILSQGAAHGLQLRSGGIAEDNLFVRNAIGMNAGYSEYPKYNTENTYVRNNVVTGGRPQIPNDNTGPQSGALWGIWKQLINNYYCYNNIVCNIYNTEGGNINPFANQAPNEFGDNNIAWNWVNNNFPETDPGWLNPNRTVGTYNATRGEEGSFEAFIEAARNRPVGTWPYDLSAYAVNEYIREGFSVPGNTAPVANFSISEHGDVPVTVAFTNSSSDADNDAISYKWIFQDIVFTETGESNIIDKGISTDENPTYTYTYPGTYSVSLTVNDGKGGVATSIQNITIGGNYPPVAMLAVDVESGNAPLTVHLDASASFDADGDALLYHFNMGNDVEVISEEPVISYTFGSGEYEVQCFVTDGADTSKTVSTTITVLDPTLETDNYDVVADAYLEADNPTTNYGDVANSRVTANDRYGIYRVDYSSNVNNIVSARFFIPVKFNENRCSLYYIDDDTWQETQVTWATKPAAGILLDTTHYENDWAYFDVTDIVRTETDKVLSFLLIQDGNEWQEFRYKESGWTAPYLHIQSRIATANNTPEARIAADLVSGTAPLTVTFNASTSADADGDNLTFTWDFGDGSTASNEAIVNHTFSEKGRYTVTLIVDDGQGAENASSDIATIQISVDMEQETTLQELIEQEMFLSPIPAHNSITLTLPQVHAEEFAVVEVFMPNGICVLQKDIHIQETNTIDISALPQGTYVLKLHGNELSESMMFVKL